MKAFPDQCAVLRCGLEHRAIVAESDRQEAVVFTIGMVTALATALGAVYIAVQGSTKSESDTKTTRNIDTQ
jgi:hypothetical protein